MNKVRTYIRYAPQIMVCTLLMACMCVHGMDHNGPSQQYRQNSSHNSEDIPHFDEPDSPTIHDERSFQPLFELSSDRSNDPESDDLCSFISDVGNSQHTSGPVNDSHESPIGHINSLSPHSHSHISPLSNPFNEKTSESPIDRLPGTVINGEGYETSNSNERETTDSNQQQYVETTTVETGEATLETNENHNDDDNTQSPTTNTAISVSNLANDTATSQPSMGLQWLMGLFRGIHGQDSHPLPVEQALEKKNGVLNESEEYVPYFDTSQLPYCPICMTSVVDWQSHIKTTLHASLKERFKSDESRVCAPYARCKECNRNISNTYRHTSVNCKPTSFLDNQPAQARIVWAVKHDRGYIFENEKGNRMYRPCFSKDMPRTYCPACNTEVKKWAQHLSSDMHRENFAGKNMHPFSKKALCIACNSLTQDISDHGAYCLVNAQRDIIEPISTEGGGSHSRDKGKGHVGQSDNDYASGTHSNFSNQYGSDNGEQSGITQLNPAMIRLHSNIVPNLDTSQPSRKRRYNTDNQHNKVPRHEESDQTREGNNADEIQRIPSDGPIEQALEKRHGFLNEEK